MLKDSTKALYTKYVQEDIVSISEFIKVQVLQKDFKSRVALG